MADQGRQRLRIEAGGVVQGVGFRPFVYGLARACGLAGFVRNDGDGLIIEVEGPAATVTEFERRLWAERPVHARPTGIARIELAARGEDGFRIEASRSGARPRAGILPDLATCPECAGEIRDPDARRYRYPFTNCTRCGPRYSILTRLPYDRPNTTMAGFTMCADCRAEYENPADRRFHAQPIACPACGPALALWQPDGRAMAGGDEALVTAAGALRQGAIVAIKGLGGFHLAVLAGDAAAVRRLRERKRRRSKPLAIMIESLAALEAVCSLDDGERALVTAPEAPIVLVRRRSGAAIAGEVAPETPWLGAMLPYTPLHQLLCAELGAPVVLTSGNLSEEPICTDEREAVERLGAIADLLLIHDRPIARHVDDSVARIMAGRPMLLRRARGYAPSVVGGGGPPVIGWGAHLKNAPAVGGPAGLVLGQHVGDLDDPRSTEVAARVVADLRHIYDVAAADAACDLHPDYGSTRLARSSGAAVHPVQHHHAHVLACCADNELDGPVVGVSWDGAGYGPDGTVWGGEVLRVDGDAFERIAHLRTFPLPGGDAAAREPRRSALGLLYELHGAAALERTDLAPIAAFTAAERRVLGTALQRGLACPRTSSAGRLFDAVAALLDLRQRCDHEGDAAMQLEHRAEHGTGPAYPMPLTAGIIDWGPTIEAILADPGARPADVAARFHAALVAAIVRAAQSTGLPRVCLTGGCFQNRRLLEGTVHALRAAGLEPYWHRLIPTNDGGIAVGQVRAVWALMSPG